ncbi:next to BRCA1 gene 1 protein-like isoform X1 [Montipora capricornis]|uniref:next to BRCA1 gene 1 protein-like isoform X1 n=1 Tax=Montipora capricornis TaxID=246305 RepID=UPI0035F1D053
MSTPIKVKVGSKSSTRRLEVNTDCSWEQLKLQIRELLDLQEDFALKYIDDEDEVVTLGTQGELEEALKVTKKAGLLRLVIENPSDPSKTTEIECFKDILGESPRGTPAPKRKFLVNSIAQSDESCAFKTAKMDKIDQETLVSDPGAEEASEAVEAFESPSKKNKVEEDITGNEGISEDITHQVQNMSTLEPPCIDEEGSDSPSGDQYVPLAQLMVPQLAGRPPRPPPPSVQPKKSRKGRSVKNCYHQLAESVAVELAAMNDTLHQKLRKSFQKLQGKEEPLSTELQSFEDVEEDTYVFVNQQGNLMASNDDVELENENQISSVKNETSPDQIQDRKVEACGKSPCCVIGSGTRHHKVDYVSVEETVQRVVQETLPQIIEKTVTHLKELQLDEESPEQIPGKSTIARVVHKGIVCAECSQAVIGIRYKCCFCADYDLCEDCEAKEGIHHPDHFFAKLRNHIPGIGRKNGEMVPVLKEFVYRTVMKEERKDKRNEEKKKEKEERREGKKRGQEERKEEKRRDNEERKYEKRRDKEERKMEKRKNREEMKEWKKENFKMLTKAARPEEKDVREMKKRLRHVRCERNSATALEVLKKCQKAEFIADASIPDGTALRGGQKFLKRWIVKNKGRRWSARTTLHCLEGNIIVASGENMVTVPTLKLDEEGELSVPFIAPPAPGHYESKWQLCHHGILFGPLFWCQIVVKEDEVESGQALKDDSSEPTKHQSHDNTSLLNSAFEEHDTSPVRKLVEDIVPPGVPVVNEDADDASGSEGYLSSEDTAGFENVMQRRFEKIPELMAAREVAQVAELEWDTAGCALDQESCDIPEVEELVVCSNEDAVSDVESIASDVSGEYMVVPVPPCFYPEAPLNADPTHVTISMIEYQQLSESQHAGFSSRQNSDAPFETNVIDGSLEEPFTEDRVDTYVEAMMEDCSVTRTDSVETTVEVDSNIDQRDSVSAEATSEVESAANSEPENHVFDLASETMPVLPEPLVPERGLGAGIAVGSAITDLSVGSGELQAPITNEPLPILEPAEESDSDTDDDDDDDFDDEEEGDDNDQPTLPIGISPPIAAQPVAGTDEHPPVALQPEPSTSVAVTPTTARTVVEVPNSSSDSPSQVVSDVLSSALDAVTNAGRAVINTVDNFFTGAPNPGATATYNPEEGCEISVNTTAAESDSRAKAPTSGINWTTRKVGQNTRVLELRENRDCSEVELVTFPPGRSPATCLDCLMEMGFCDRKLNEKLLRKHNYNVALVVNELLSLTDNEWSSSRH